jgi:hypothetical protein
MADDRARVKPSDVEASAPFDSAAPPPPDEVKQVPKGTKRATVVYRGPSAELVAGDGYVLPRNVPTEVPTDMVQALLAGHEDHVVEEVAG